MDCFSTSQQRSSNIKDDRTNQEGKQKSTTKLTNKLIYQTPPEPNKAAACNLSSIERTVSAVSSRSKRSLVNNIEKQKQSTLESFIQKNSSENFSHIKHQPETESSSSPDTSTPSSLEMFKKKTNRKTVQDSNAVQTCSKQNCTRKSSSAAECLTENEDVFQKSQPSTPKAVPKISRQRRTSAALRSADSFSNLCRSPDVNDGEAFEDFFSPANNNLKRRASLFGSTSENVHLPTFDLEDPNKKGRKSSAKSAGTKRKLGNIDVKEILLNSSDTVNKSEETVPEKLESRPERLSVRSEAKEMPRTEEIKLQPSAKKQRRPTRQSCIVASVEKNDEGSDKPCPVNERKGWTATSLTSSTAVNVKLQKTPEPDHPPKHGIEKRMGLKSM